MKFRSKKLLVTGGAGFIGSNFISYILEKYNDLFIYNLDLLTYAGNLNNTNSFKSNRRYKFIHGNISDEKLLNKIFKKYEIDGVINFAAESHVDNSIKNPEIFIKTNINGVYNLLNSAYSYWFESPFKPKNKFNFARFHQISTDEVYGSIEKGSFNEHSKYSPNSPYSASKASADMLVRSFNKTYGLDTAISISSNNYGLNQNKEKFIPTVINSILKDKKIPIYGNGKNIRDWLCVLDNSEAICKIFNKGKSGCTYNVGSKNELTNIQLANKIYNVMFEMNITTKKFNHFIDYVEDRFGHDFRYSISTKKIKNELGWNPKNIFEKSIKNIINNIKEQQK